MNALLVLALGIALGYVLALATTVWAHKHTMRLACAASELIGFRKGSAERRKRVQS